ncbi:hypothetical protein CEN49_00570 [Fischerella thermalis CCMEE 5273]|uniref:Uncharacterized protein n=2 Tax=Chlorogloeopsis fritschii TaxID=1124 RepID=A0A3S0ZUG0_CHLFR|nr:hypothetical protein [Chlorogloeopsis fritschii]PMB11889.1 hypothetical protein CEN49_00570 [Fischerella thermalis CCMEE 5273]PMB43311.1 hypothetical protein CEN40_16155 [Fischerella thermalis CCMEE 5205]RUR83802.1 hypothetical protein PCC6912_20450 [Chlorogloeopsis fritschii PCC 6912]
MFDTQQQKITDNYLQITSTTSQAALDLAKILIETYKKIREILKEREEADKIAITIGKDTYNLIPDESTPGAYKWQKIDLCDPQNHQVITQGEGAQITDFQAQTIAIHLVQDVPDLDDNQPGDYEAAIKITAYTSSGNKIIIYEQDDEGKCRTNLITKNLSQDEIIDVAYEPIVKLLPASSDIVKNYQDTKEFIEGQESDLQSETNVDNQPSNLENSESTVSTIPPETVENQPGKVEENLKEFVSSNLQEKVENKENYTSEEIPVTSNKKLVEEEEKSAIAKRATPKKESLEEEEQYAAEYTYQQVAKTPRVEPQAQQWARQVEVPVYEIKNKQAQKERYNGENKDIAKAATEMLKKYGTIEQDGSRIYRSDAFVIRQEGDTINIHRRSDELHSWKNSLFEFKPGKGNKEPKFTKHNQEMLGVERQEFLMVGEHLQDKGTLPDLSTSDIRDVANTLGSLAPVGTIKTLEVFKQNEMLDTLNNTLLAVGKDELTVGEFTIKRTRDPQGKKASLQLFKKTEERGTQELVKFELTKTEEGIKKEVAKMNISDYDINQVKFIAQNASKLNLEQIFEGGQTAQVQQPPAQEPQQIQSAGDIPVKVHPYIAQEWAEMTKKGGLAWGGVLNQGNEEILQKLKDNNGKLPLADQREMYLKIMTHKTNEAQRLGESTIEFTRLKYIMQDLQQWRAEEIKQQFTPTQVVSFPQKQTVAAATPQGKSKGIEM